MNRVLQPHPLIVLGLNVWMDKRDNPVGISWQILEEDKAKEGKPGEDGSGLRGRKGYTGGR